MRSRFGRTLVVVTVVVAAVVMGYTAWETRDLRVAFDRMAAGDEQNLTEMMIALAQTEGHLARVRESIEVLGSAVASEPDEKARAGVVEGRLTSSLTAAQREILQLELKKWAGELQEQRERGWAALRESLTKELSRSETESRKALTSALNENQRTLTNRLNALAKPSGASEAQGEALAGIEQRLAAILDADENRAEAARQRTERDAEHWKQLFLSLQESQEVARQRYAELAARLDELRKELGKPGAAAGAPQPGQATPPADQGDPTERQRLAEFCAEVPQSALCRDL